MMHYEPIVEKIVYPIRIIPSILKDYGVTEIWYLRKHHLQLENRSCWLRLDCIYGATK